MMEQLPNPTVPVGRKTGSITISFGLVHLKAGLYPAHKEANQDFHLYSECHHKPVRYVKVCEECQQPVQAPKKGLVISKNEPPVIFEEQELENAPTPTTFLKFVPVGSISPLMLRGEDYYLAPEEGGEKAFTLIFRICEQLGLGLLLKQVIRGKERLIFIRVLNGTVVLSYLWYPEEIRSPPQLPQVQLNEKEVELAVELIKQLIEEIDWREIKNETAIWLKQLIEAKLQGMPVEVKPKVEVKETADLLQALQIAVQQKKKQKVEEGR